MRFCTQARVTDLCFEGFASELDEDSGKIGLICTTHTCKYFIK